MAAIWDIDNFFITYDEPLKEDFWRQIKKNSPWVKRIDGVKGFDAAHKACAEQSKTERFITIDGDNLLTETYYSTEMDFDSFAENEVISWTSKNELNGLCYGNGGVKCWTRKTVMEMKTHENAEDEESSVDFCFQLNYLQMPQILSTTSVTATPYQAFRAGFREGVKMVLDRGKIPEFSGEQPTDIFELLARSNLQRLRIWCSVGADVFNGNWAIYGARLGTYMTLLTEWDYSLVRDYDWFRDFWTNEIKAQFSGTSHSCDFSNYSWNNSMLENEIHRIGDILNDRLNFQVAYLNGDSSRFFKSTYVNPLREGRMF